PELVADALRTTPAAVADVAAVIWRKTEGNPFFIRQFMHALHRDGLLFDARAIDALAITDNVADLLTRKLEELPQLTRDALVIAAAIGTRFDLDTLSRVAARPVEAIEEALAAGADLVVATHSLADAPTYAFGHDRI